MAVVIKPTKKNISVVADVLDKGGVVVCPTDTVYGFLALSENKKAVEKIFKIKKRPKNKTLPIFVKDLKMAKEIAEISAEQEKVIKAKWPGKYTFVLKLQNTNPKSKINSKSKIKISKLCVGDDGTVALRVPKYKFLNDLLKKIGKPLAQTSVNVSNQPPLSKIKDIIEIFEKDKRIDLMVDGGDLPKRKSSTIIDLTNNKKIIRK